MNLDMLAGALVFLFIGVPVVGFLLFLVTAPFRAAANAVKRRQPARRWVWNRELKTYEWVEK